MTEGKMTKALRIWRESDHEDAIQLSRHEVITILEEIDRIQDALRTCRELRAYDVNQLQHYRDRYGVLK